MNSNYSHLSRGGLTSAQVTALITSQVPDPLTIAKGGVGSNLNSFIKRSDFRRSIGLTRMERIHLESQGTASTLAGAVNTNLWQTGAVVMQVLATTDGLGRFTPANSTASSGPTLFPVGTSALNTLNWSKSWSLHIVMTNRVATRSGANDSGRFTVNIGKNEAAGSAVGSTHALTARGVSFKLLGKNGTTSATELSVSAHNGTSETAGAVSTQVTNTYQSAHRYELLYIRGVGFYVYQGATLVASNTTPANLPTGNSSANECVLSFLVENQVAGAGVACTNFIQSAFLFTEE